MVRTKLNTTDSDRLTSLKWRKSATSSVKVLRRFNLPTFALTRSLTSCSAKRYERMMKAHGIAPNASTTRPVAPIRTQKTERHTSGNCSATPSKKRKTLAFEDENPNQDDEEDYGKPSFKHDPELLRVKNEAGQNGFEDAMNISPTSYPMLPNVSSFGEASFVADPFDANSSYSIHSGYQTPRFNDASLGGQYAGFDNYSDVEFAPTNMPTAPTNQNADFVPIVVD